MPKKLRVPRATYRVQLNAGFRFADARAIVDYLEALGVSDLYTSPVTTAREGSTHGYDVVDHEQVSAELGGEEGLGGLVEALRARDMGLVVDVVPNHMGIAGSANRWWNDVLENGPSSPYAEFFDIDWNPPKSDLANKLLLPTLGDQYGRVLENQELQLEYEAGAFFARYYELRLPIAPRSSILVLERLLRRLETQLAVDDPARVELESIVTSIRHLPPRTSTDPDALRERIREKEVAKRRLAALHDASRVVSEALADVIVEINGKKGDPRSFDALEQLLADQAYRVSFWRVASDEINYRRFFDINELAAICVERPQVFHAVHEPLFKLVARGWVTGLRIDHVDGLYDPERYLAELRDGCRAARGDGHELYTVVEKILMPGERLIGSWAVDGTTGYDFLNQIGGLFIDGKQSLAFGRLFARLTGHTTPPDALFRECKQLVLDVAMASELTMLSRTLDRISEQHRHTRDFTRNSLHAALKEVVACFPVYRSYLSPDVMRPGPEDRKHIAEAIRCAKRHNPAIAPTIYDFIGSVMLGEAPDGLTEEQLAVRRSFTLRLQQLTGPISAKGLEDTAFYRYVPIASLAEVGGDPAQFGVSPRALHRANLERRERWPRTMLATSTHDTKRSEDVRARLAVLSEIPGAWSRAVLRWREVNDPLRPHVEGVAVPDRTEEYLLFQSILGIWPLRPGPIDRAALDELTERIEAYMIKAVREAKVHTSWINPNEAYEQGLRDYVRRILAPGPDNRFVRQLASLHRRIMRAGMLNGLAQVLLKIASPGVPDFYQGSELWSFHLVDPDNRRPVDYAVRRTLLERIAPKPGETDAALVERLLRAPEDGAIKLHVTARALASRRRDPDLFVDGAYMPLEPAGRRADHVFAFGRLHGRSEGGDRGDRGREAIAVTGRLFLGVGAARGWPLGHAAWVDTTLPLGADLVAPSYRDVLTGQVIRPSVDGRGRRSISIAALFSHLPLALLESEPA